MKKKRFLVSFSAFMLGGLILAYGQSGAPSADENAPAESAVKTAAKTAEPRNFESKVKPIGMSSALRTAAAENARLKDDLAWTFGKKQQRGWHLYVPLMQHALGTDKAPDSIEFAQAVSEWQKKAGLAATGRIDRETLFSFVKYWQSRRLNSSAYPSDDKLFGAPVADFYDSSREAHLLKVEREAYAAYKKMLRAAAADKSLNLKLDANGELAPEEKFMRIVSAFRSREYQAQLRKKSPNSGSAGLAVNSPHFTGRALDIYVGGEPVITKDENRAVQVQTPVYRWLVKNAEKFGFYPYYYEPWHWEYVGK